MPSLKRRARRWGWTSASRSATCRRACSAFCGNDSASGWPSRASAQAKLFQLLQRAHAPADLLLREEARVLGVAHLADVDVAARIEGEAVRRDEFARLEARAVLAAQASQQLAFLVDERESRTEVGMLAVDAHSRAQLADHELRSRAAAAVERARPV